MGHLNLPPSGDGHFCRFGFEMDNDCEECAVRAARHEGPFYLQFRHPWLFTPEREHAARLAYREKVSSRHLKAVA